MLTAIIGVLNRRTVRNQVVLDMLKCQQEQEKQLIDLLQRIRNLERIHPKERRIVMDELRNYVFEDRPSHGASA